MSREHPILFSAPMVRAILAGRKTQTRRVVSPQPRQWDANPVFWLWRESDPLTDSMLIERCPHGRAGDRLWVRETWRTCEDGNIHGTATGESDIHYRADLDEPPAEGCWRPSIFMPRWASRITLGLTDVRIQRLQDISEEDARAEGVEPLTTPETWLCIPRDGGPFEVFVEPDAEMRATLEHVKHQPARAIGTALLAFAELWDAINGKRPGCAWSDNPWVWALTFKRVQP